ncbi:MAG: trypsin-like peptidase domain-containing protein, partial [Deltaproteobacteria bacterium]|nr:trypsin-like peptidase domain-containing protein [Deltaproteobacteria bacterium]
MHRKPNRVHLLLALVAVVGCRERPSSKKVAEPVPERPVRIVRPSAPGSFVELVAKVEQSVVHLRAPEKVSGGPAAILPGGSADGLPRANRALGTGFIIDTEGHVLTNHHVLGNTTDVVVVLPDGDEHKAKIVGRDPKLDIALIKIAPLPKLRPVRFGDSDNLRRGEWVLALGNPFGAEVTASAGIISSLGHLSHEAFVQPAELNYMGFIQTDMRIDASNSGGPITNTAGEVIAIATASEELGGSVGYAVPISRAQAVVPQLKKDGVVSRSYVGMYVDRVSAADAKKAGLDAPRGALITDVVSGS